MCTRTSDRSSYEYVNAGGVPSCLHEKNTKQLLFEQVIGTATQGETSAPHKIAGTRRSEQADATRRGGLSRVGTHEWIGNVRG